MKETNNSNMKNLKTDNLGKTGLSNLCSTNKQMCSSQNIGLDKHAHISMETRSDWQMDFKLSEEDIFTTRFPRTVAYDSICQNHPPYSSLLLVNILRNIDAKNVSIFKFQFSISSCLMEEADSLFGLLNQGIYRNFPQIILKYSSFGFLINLLNIALQRLELPLFMATDEFLILVWNFSNEINYIKFGEKTFNEKNHFCDSLAKSLKLLTKYQIANLVLLIEYCQFWIRKEIISNLDKSNYEYDNHIYEISVRVLSAIFGIYAIGIPTSFIGCKLISGTRFSLNKIRQKVFSLLLSIPSFEMWHLWSIASWS